MSNIGIIGYGNMGSALIRGIKAKSPDKKIAVIDKDNLKKEIAEKDNLNSFDNYKDFFSFADTIIIAIKPQDLEILFNEVNKYSENKNIISIAAGKSIKSFQDGLKSKKVVRFMPNLAASCGKSPVGVAFSENLDQNFKNEALEIAEAIGTPIELSEKLMPAITGLSGSGIAYVFSFIHAMALGGTQTGIPYDKSLNISLETIEGAVEVLRANKENPISMLSKVISPAGTTIAGLKEIEKSDFTAAVINAIETASKRAKELEN